MESNELWKIGINPETKRKIKIGGQKWKEIGNNNKWIDENLDEKSIKNYRKYYGDKFYTKKIVAEQLVDKWNSIIKPEENNIIIEPSCGNGSFIKVLKKLNINNIIGIDIDNIINNNEKILDKFIQKDFLLFSLNEIVELNEINLFDIHIIGNPPFGKQSSMAKKFIKKSIDLNVKTISFILPKSFKKDSNKKIFLEKGFNCIYEENLSNKSFIYEEMEYDVPCVFQIWKKEEKDDNYIKIKKILSNYFSYVNSDNKYDIIIQRVGSKTSLLTKKSEDIKKSKQSNYFIKLNYDIDVEKFISEYVKISFPDDNTVGPKSLSKNELNYLTNKIKKEDIINEIGLLNLIINKTFLYEFAIELTDEKLMDKYLSSNSILEKKIILTSYFEKYNIEFNKEFFNDIIKLMISSGLKGAIRGLKFNELIKNLLINKLTDKKYVLKFEKKHDKISEKYDFYISDGYKEIVGMNQIDFWSGGQQVNRSDKYLELGIKNNNTNFHFICVICDYIQITSLNNRVFKILNEGIKKNIIVYPLGLLSFIENFFN